MVLPLERGASAGPGSNETAHATWKAPLPSWLAAPYKLPHSLSLLVAGSVAGVAWGTHALSTEPIDQEDQAWASFLLDCTSRAAFPPNRHHPSTSSSSSLAPSFNPFPPLQAFRHLASLAPSNPSIPRDTPLAFSHLSLTPPWARNLSAIVRESAFAKPPKRPTANQPPNLNHTRFPAPVRYIPCKRIRTKSVPHSTCTHRPDRSALLAFLAACERQPPPWISSSSTNSSLSPEASPVRLVAVCTSPIAEARRS